MTVLVERSRRLLMGSLQVWVRPHPAHSKPGDCANDPLYCHDAHRGARAIFNLFNCCRGDLPRGAEYLFSGGGCRAATTPPRAAAERLARTARSAGSLCAAARGATRRSATSSTTLNRYLRWGGEGEDNHRAA